MQSGHRNLKSKFSRYFFFISLLFLGFQVQTGNPDLPAGPWIFLREDTPPNSVENLVEVIAVGDVMPGRGMTHVPGIFDHVRDVLEPADLVVGNLEGVMAIEPSTGILPGLHIPAGTAVSLAGAGFDILSLANNHALDAGPEGKAETVQYLRSAGIQPLESLQPIFREINGVKIGFLAWNEVPYSGGIPLLSAVEKVRPEVNILIILVHWGQEYLRHPNDTQRKLAKGLVEAGVDLILGSHPHVVQDLAIIPREDLSKRPGLVAYSLGNFVFDQGWDDTGQGLVLRLIFDLEGLRGVQALPIWTAPRPTWMAMKDAVVLLERVLPETRTGYACSQDTCDTIEVPQERRSGLFWSGAIDLTGDGNPEFIRRQEGRVEIYQDGQVAWQSPVEWQVVDLALGDPNEDGRYELILALDKPNPVSEVSSQPFIVGYRSGSYRVLWGGSPVSDPILEVELGDLDGEGTSELVVIEASEDRENRTITLWRWHGWGFSLVWRSPPGNYRDLIILPSEENYPSRLSVSTRFLPDSPNSSQDKATD
jgi:hypothetical protein